MSNTPNSLRLRVPASTSNLGPGFDLLGLALSLFLEVELRPLPKARAHQLLRKGRLLGELEADSEDLTLKAFNEVSKRYKIQGYYQFLQSSEIPIGRGMGSSGAAIAAGLLLAQEVSEEEIPMQSLISIGVEIEGHPDNVVASLLGGLTLSQRFDEQPEVVVIHQDLHPSIGFSVAWPATQLATKASRDVLPEYIPLAQAAQNSARLAFLLEGLRSGSKEHLARGGIDHLHVPHRLPLIQGSEATLAAARDAGAWMASISGSGSALIALGPKDHMEVINEAMAATLAKFAPGVEACVLEPVLGTPEAQRS